MYNPITALKNNDDDKEGRLLWTGEKRGKSRLSLCIEMISQYRMQGELAVICENFANGLQTVQDATTLCDRVLKPAEIDEEEKAMHSLWKSRWESGRVRLLRTDNNSKAGLNQELAMTKHNQTAWTEWNLRENTSGKENNVVDQLGLRQYVWQGMPVICLQNHQGTDVVNGAQCVVVHVVKVSDNQDLPKLQRGSRRER